MDGSMEDVRRIRADGEREKVRFDPQRHPGMIKRLIVLGMPDEGIATVLGIRPDKLKAWFSRYRELDGCRVEARMREADLVDTAWRKALGKQDPVTGEYEGGDVRLMIFLLERRCGLVKPQVGKAAAPGKTSELPDHRLREALERVESVMGGDPELASMLDALNAERGPPH